MISKDSEIFTSAISFDDYEQNEFQSDDPPQKQEDKNIIENTERINIENEKEPKVNEGKPVGQNEDEVKNNNDNENKNNEDTHLPKEEVECKKEEKKEPIGITLQHTVTFSIRKESDIEYAPEKQNEISTSNKTKKEEINQIIKEEILQNPEKQDNKIPIEENNNIVESQKNEENTSKNIQEDVKDEKIEKKKEEKNCPIMNNQKHEENFEIEINLDGNENHYNNTNNIIPNNKESNGINQVGYSYNPEKSIKTEKENFNLTQEKFEEININPKEDDNTHKNEEKMVPNYFNEDIIQDRRCQTLTNFSSNEKEIFNFDDDQTNMINPFSSTQFNPRTTDYFLLDSDSKIEINPHKDKSKYIGSFISYDINIVSSSNPSNKFTKCTRRYDNIKKFYDKLTKRYPYIYLPKLSSKKFTVKILENEAFLSIRKKELCFLLNYIYSSDKLAKLPESVVFINSSIFKEEYFTNKKNDFTYELKLTHSKITNAWNSLKNYFSKEEEKDAKQMEYNLMFKYYEDLYKKIDSIKGELMIIRENLSLLNFNYTSLTSNFNYLKDIDNINTKFIEECEGVNDKMAKVKNDDFNLLFDEFLIYDLSLKGIVNLLSRYIKFCQHYNAISKEFKNYQKNKSLYSVDIGKIKEKGNEKKLLFENNINEQINEFIFTHSNTFDKLLQDFSDFLKKSNYEEIKIVRKIIDCFSNKNEI